MSDKAAITVLDLGDTPVSKVRQALVNAWKLLTRADRHDIAYVSVPGQRGSWLILLAVAVLRLRRLTPWFHHHSFRAINCWPLRVMKALVTIAGPRQRHILLSPGMRSRFAALYLPTHPPTTCLSLSNAFLFGPQALAAQRPGRPSTLGHISVLSREKGVFYLLSLFERIQIHRPDIRLILAGPSNDPELLVLIGAMVKRFPDKIDYLGLVTGDAKGAFYRNIDLFVLPTTLVDEAEPLVMLESYEHGVDVVATRTGCIPDRLLSPDRLLTLDLEQDTFLVIKQLSGAECDWDARRTECITHAEQINRGARTEAETVFKALFAPSALTSRPIDALQSTFGE